MTIKYVRELNFRRDNNTIEYMENEIILTHQGRLRKMEIEGLNVLKLPDISKSERTKDVQ